MNFAFLTSSMSGEQFRGMRRELDMTQEALAELLDVTRITIIRWEAKEVVPTHAKLALYGIKKLLESKLPGERGQSELLF